MTARATARRWATEGEPSVAKQPRKPGDRSFEVTTLFCSDVRTGIVSRARRRFVRSWTGWHHRAATQAYLVTTSERSPDTTLEPLTHCNLQGVPYRREPSVESQIREALALESADLFVRAQLSDKNHPEYLQEETIAYLIRRAHRAGNDALVNGLADVLVERCTRYL